MTVGDAVLIIPPNFKGRIWFCFWSRKTISRAPHAHQILWAFLERAKQAIACDQSLRSRRLWFNDESRRLDAPHRTPDSKSTMQTQAQHTRTGSTSWRVILRIDQSKCHACAIPSTHTHTQSKVYLKWRVQQFLSIFRRKITYTSEKVALRARPFEQLILWSLYFAIQLEFSTSREGLYYVNFPISLGQCDFG